MLLPGVARAEDGTYGYLKYTVKNDKITITGLADENVTAVDIPSTIDGKTVEVITDYAFAHRKVESINIPASITTIGYCAFYNCSPLSSVTFSENSNLKTIGGKAFYKTALTSFFVPASVEEIEASIFSDCYKLSSVTFKRVPIGEKQIVGYSKYMFVGSSPTINVTSGCEKAYRTQLQLGDDVTVNGLDIVDNGLKYKVNDALDGLVCLGFSEDVQKNVFIPDYIKGCPVTAVGREAFNQKTLTSVNIPASVEIIDQSAFQGCGLSSVTFSENSNLKTIKFGAFGNNVNLTSVTIPASVEKITNRAFWKCSNLSSVTFNRTPIGEYKITGYSNTMFAECSNLTVINVPDGCSEMYKAQLSSNADKILGEDIVEDGLKYAYNLNGDGYICKGFSGDATDALIIPAAIGDMPVTDVKEGAFSGCEKVERITIHGDATSIASNAFQSMTALKHIFVTNDVYSYYKNQNFENADKLLVYEKDGKLLLTDANGISKLENPTFYDPQALSYSRKVETADGEYATLCLPFAIKLSETHDVFEKVYVPLAMMIHDKAHSDDTKDSFILMLKEQEADAEIPAGQPMFVKLAVGKDKFTFINSGKVTLQKGMEPSAFNMTVLDWDGTSGLMTENRQFSISYGSRYGEPIAASADMNVWSFNDNGTFGPQSQGTLNPFRLFLHVEDLAAATQAKAYSISIGVGDDSTTGIREIIPADTIGASGSSKKYDGIIYDLNGRKVATADEVQSLPKGIYILNGKKMVVK